MRKRKLLSIFAWDKVERGDLMGKQMYFPNYLLKTSGPIFRRLLDQVIDSCSCLESLPAAFEGRLLMGSEWIIFSTIQINILKRFSSTSYTIWDRQASHHPYFSNVIIPISFIYLLKYNSFTSASPTAVIFNNHWKPTWRSQGEGCGGSFVRLLSYCDSSYTIICRVERFYFPLSSVSLEPTQCWTISQKHLAYSQKQPVEYYGQIVRYDNKLSVFTCFAHSAKNRRKARISKKIRRKGVGQYYYVDCRWGYHSLYLAYLQLTLAFLPKQKKTQDLLPSDKSQKGKGTDVEATNGRDSLNNRKQ